MAISLAVAAALVAALTGKGAQHQSRGHFLKKFSSPRVRPAQTGFTQSPAEVVTSGSDRPGISAPADSAAVEEAVQAVVEEVGRSARPEHCCHPGTVCAAAAGSGGRPEKTCPPAPL